jgi:uncharacterized protein YbjT (DUF2867 family)
MFEGFSSMKADSPILVTGATGYVGGRLVPLLLAAGHRVRAMGRSPEKLAGRPWATDPGVELVRGDTLDRASLATAASGCRAAYYLVHSMIAQKGSYAEADRTSARNMVAVAAEAGLHHQRALLPERLPRPARRHGADFRHRG